MVPCAMIDLGFSRLANFYHSYANSIGNFWGRKLSQISWFRSCFFCEKHLLVATLASSMWKFSPRKSYFLPSTLKVFRYLIRSLAKLWGGYFRRLTFFFVLFMAITTWLCIIRFYKLLVQAKRCSQAIRGEGGREDGRVGGWGGRGYFRWLTWFLCSLNGRYHQVMYNVHPS